MEGIPSTVIYIGLKKKGGGQETFGEILSPPPAPQVAGPWVPSWEDRD